MHALPACIHIVKLERKVAQLNSRIIAVDSVSMKEFPVWTNFPNKQMFDALCQYVEQRKGKFWRGAHSLQHGHFADKVNNRPGPDRVLRLSEELFLVLVKLKTGYHNQEQQRLFNVSETHISNLITTSRYMVYGWHAT